jgi:hypothetical protein
MNHSVEWGGRDMYSSIGLVKTSLATCLRRPSMMPMLPSDSRVVPLPNVTIWEGDIPA